MNPISRCFRFRFERFEMLSEYLPVTAVPPADDMGTELSVMDNCSVK